MEMIKQAMEKSGQKEKIRLLRIGEKAEFKKVADTIDLVGK